MIKPILQALLIADHVYQDKITGKHIVCGIFGTMFTSVSKADKEIDLAGGDRRQAGLKAGAPFAYVSLTDVEGSQEFDLRYVRLSDEQLIFSGRLSVTSDDRLRPIQVGVPLPLLPAAPGVYALELVWNCVEPLGSYRVTVTSEPDESNDAE